MEYPEDGHISVIGDRWLYPIVKLLEELNKYEFGDRNDVQVSAIENGYSVAIIISMASMVESFLNKIRCHVNDKIGSKDTTPNRKYFRTYLEESPDEAKKLDELWAIRDAIIHNHIWGANTTWDNDWNLVYVDRPEIVDDKFYGDNNYRNVINSKTLTTNRLGLNLVPTKIGKDDAIKVIVICYEILEQLEKINPEYCCISYLKINFDNNEITFPNFINNLKQKIT
ncbi:MAG: hypothetical protein GY865_10805 [candidate division Zixibacteria bacterium]|nr:hypothetical protein [candidate division Zixibacteria bacterium]